MKKKLQNKKKVGNSGHYRRVELEKEASHLRTIPAILKAPSSVLSNSDLSLYCRKKLSFLKNALINRNIESDASLMGSVNYSITKARAIVHVTC